MGKFKGTPAPWSHDGTGITCGPRLPNDSLYMVPVVRGRTDAEKAANLRAMTAAPDFLAASEPLVRSLDPTAMDNEIVEVRAGDLKALAAALSKALGEET